MIFSMHNWDMCRDKVFGFGNVKFELPIRHQMEILKLWKRSGHLGSDSVKNNFG